MMPGMTGDGLASRIRSLPSLIEIKLVLVSSTGSEGRAEAARLVDAVIDKPLRQRDLLDCLTALLANSSWPSARAKHADADLAEMASRGTAPRSLRVLLAEDNRINQLVAANILTNAGHQVETAETGRQAVAAVEKAIYDVVLMDVQMPELDGVEATQLIRALPPPRGQIPIIAVTAHAMAGAREEYLALGMNDYISKPIDPAELLAKLAGFGPCPTTDRGSDDAEVVAPIGL